MDSVRLIGEMVYNERDRLLEKRLFIQAPLTILSDAGEKELLQKADTRITKYTYDDRGLLIAETETVNGKVIAKLEYEYL
jgi:YD repeat-containing protein